MMKPALIAALLVLFLAAAFLPASPGEPVPLWPKDLLDEVKKATPPVAKILSELAVPDETGTEPTYENRVLDRVEMLLKAEDPKEGAWAAEKALRAALRYSLSQREPTGLPDDPLGTAQNRLSDKLLDVRRRLLKILPIDQDLGPALEWADVWLPLYGPASPLGDDVRSLWIRKAELQMKAGETAGVRTQLDRIEATFSQSPQADALRKNLRERADALLGESKALPDGKAVGNLQQALLLWPRLPGLRDEIEKRKQTYQVLYVAVRDLPEYFSPALAFCDSERQAVELIFESLVEARHDVKLGPRYRPALIERLTAGTGNRRPFLLRRDAYWADGEQFTAADVRQTVRLQTQPGAPDGAAWRGSLDPPQLGDNRFGLEIVYRQGLLDPWAPLCFKMLPQHAHGKELARADDIEFAKQPIGTGPYQYQGREGLDGRVYLVLRANSQYVRNGKPSPGPIREIRFYAWKSADEIGKHAPHLVLDPLPEQIAALNKQGYTDFRSMTVPRVWFLGVNHRRAPFANLNVRLALAQAIDRQGLLDRHFRADLPGSAPLTANGLFPRGSWANCSAQRVPEELYRLEGARADARKAAKELAKVEWTLKYPDGDPRLHAAFKELAEQIGKVFAAAAAKVVIRPVPLSPRELQKAVRERDFDLVYHHLDVPDSPFALEALFDPNPDAIAAGGSNFSGCEQDAKLQGLLRSALHHRHFPTVQGFMQDIHARLHETMPVIPLWQLPYSVAVSSKLRTPDLDPLAVFGNVLEWKIVP